MKKITKNLILTLLAFSMIFAVTGCGNTEDVTPAVKSMDITLSINYPAKAEIPDIYQETFKVEEHATVLDALEIYCNVNDIPLTVELTSGSVHGIDDIYNGDFYRSRHWRYKINGKLCADPENEKILKNGDSVEWVFVK